MDTSTSSNTAKAPVTPLPATDAGAKPDGDKPVAGRLLDRVTSSAHDAIDSVAAKVGSLAGGLKDGVADAGDTRDEWIGAARDAIRQHPFATVAGAVVVGAALLSLLSSPRD